VSSIGEMPSTTSIFSMILDNLPKIAFFVVSFSYIFYLNNSFNLPQLLFLGPGPRHLRFSDICDDIHQPLNLAEILRLPIKPKSGTCRHRWLQTLVGGHRDYIPRYRKRLMIHLSDGNSLSTNKIFIGWVQVKLLPISSVGKVRRPLSIGNTDSAHRL
jgi:hypothetical protein